MSVLVGKAAPDFTVQAVMPDNSFQEVSLSDYKGKHVVLFFYPLDFTFVCPSEIIAFDHRLAEFQARDTEVLAVSIDSHFTHLAWKNTDIKNGGIGNVQFPMLADVDKSITEAYDMRTDPGIALRGSFLIDKDGIVQHQVVNALNLGRNVDEMLRMVDSLQFTEEHGEVCPAGWNKGDSGMQGSTEGVAKYLAKHADEL
jgi:peroxiredoxin (alkyl hydroperoxide reductase subunit C)